MEKTELLKREVSAYRDERKRLVHELHFLKKVRHLSMPFVVDEGLSGVGTSSFHGEFSTAP